MGAPSTPVSVAVDVAGDASVERLRTLVDHVAEIAEVPLSMRDTTPVRVSVRRVESRPNAVSAPGSPLHTTGPSC